MIRRKRTQGQAIVEFALAATLIFFLLAAAVDVGLMFFAVQGLHNAAQEGASYGSRWLIDDPATGKRALDRNAIYDRVRGESGAKGGNGFINLYDLNGNGQPDSGESGGAATNITIELLRDPTNDGDPTKDVATGAAENVVCDDPSKSTTSTCYIRVTVVSVHKMIFAFAPAFAKTVPLKSSYIMPLRDSISRGSGTGSTTKTCKVPDLIGQGKSGATSLWAGGGFTGKLSFSGSKSTVSSQQYPANTLLDCTSSMSAKLQ